MTGQEGGGMKRSIGQSPATIGDWMVEVLDRLDTITPREENGGDGGDGGERARGREEDFRGREEDQVTEGNFLIPVFNPQVSRRREEEREEGK